jgi:hypothetical protein
MPEAVAAASLASSGRRSGIDLVLIAVLVASLLGLAMIAASARIGHRRRVPETAPPDRAAVAGAPPRRRSAAEADGPAASAGPGGADHRLHAAAPAVEAWCAAPTGLSRPRESPPTNGRSPAADRSASEGARAAPDESAEPTSGPPA